MPGVPIRARGTRMVMGRDDLVRWGEELGRSIDDVPTMIAVRGDIGAGKTTLVQAICRGYGVEEAVTSPTYAIAHQYAAPRSVVHHLDLYRLASEDDLINVGWDDLIGSTALVLVEWPERAGARLPDHHLPIGLEHVASDPNRRLLLAG